MEQDELDRGERNSVDTTLMPAVEARCSGGDCEPSTSLRRGDPPCEWGGEIALNCARGEMELDRVCPEVSMPF
jgi:hypothetical protein